MMRRAWALSAEAGGNSRKPPGGGDFVPSGWQLPGDTNQDGVLDISDPVRLLQAALPRCSRRKYSVTVKNLAAGGSLVVLDVNGDSMADLSDAVYSLNYLFTRGSEPMSSEVNVSGLKTCPSSLPVSPGSSK